MHNSRRNMMLSRFIASFGTPEITGLGSEINAQDYEGPRTTSAGIAVAQHIRSLYRFLGTIAIIFVISIFHFITIIFGRVKRNACPNAEIIPKMISIVGIIDVILCGFIMVIVTARFMRCYHRGGLVCLFVIFVWPLLNLILFAVTSIVTDVNWMLIAFGSEIRNGNQTIECETSVRVFVIITTIYRLSVMSSAFWCAVYFLYQQKNERNFDSRVQFTPLV